MPDNLKPRLTTEQILEMFEGHFATLFASVDILEKQLKVLKKEIQCLKD